MGETAALLLVGVLFLVMACFLLAGKGSWLIAGYNTMSRAEKDKWNRKALCRAAGIFMLAMAAVMVVSAFFVDQVWMGRLIAAVSVGGGVALVIYVNTSGRFKQ